MTEQFEVVRATQRDQPGAIQAIKAVYDEYGFDWDPDDYHADLYDLENHYRNHDFMVAKVGDEVLGTCAMLSFPTIPGDRGTVLVGGFVRVAGADCSLERLYVPRQHRRKGIALALVSALVDAAHRSQKRRMEIWSDKRFVEAHRLYEKLGAKVVGERLCHDSEQSPEWGLALDLYPNGECSG